MTFTLTPAYGRDYTTKAAVFADYHAGKDFVASYWDNGPRTDYINREQIPAGARVTFRYGKLRKLAVLGLAR